MIQDSLPEDYQIQSRIKAALVFDRVADGSVFSPSAVSHALDTSCGVYTTTKDSKGTKEEKTR